MTTGAAIDQWNTARSIASAGRRVVEGEEEYDDVASEFDSWPFSSPKDLSETFKDATVGVETKRDEVDEFAREIMEKDAELSSSSRLSSWNKVQSIASTLLSAEEQGELDKALSELDESDNLPEKSTIQDLLRQDSNRSRRERLENLARTIYNTPQDSSEGEESSTGVESSAEVTEKDTQPEDEFEDVEAVEIQEPDVSPLALELAEALAEYYIDREADSVSQIMGEYPDVEFPARDELMMNSINTKGTRQERVYELAEWVDTWVGGSVEPEERDYEYFYGRAIPSQ